MELTEVKKLKLNATNIKSVLISSNKELKKVKTQKSEFIIRQNKKEKQKEKEEKVEKKESGVKSIFGKIKNAITSPVMSIFDKIMEFAGIILLGIIINNLPKIISGLKKFFSDNKWIIDTIKFTIDIIGKAISATINLVENFVKFAGDTKENIIKSREKIVKQIDDLSNIFNATEISLSRIILNQNQPTKPQKPKPTFQNTGGFGRYSPPILQQRYNQNPDAGLPIGKFASGGTISSSRSNAAGISAGGSNKNVFVGRESGKERRAKRSVNYFSNFSNNVKDSLNVSVLDKENNKLFDDLLNNFKELKRLSDPMNKLREGSILVSYDPSGGGLTPDPFGGGGGGPITATSSGSLKDQELYDYLRSKGFDNNQALGILANVSRESGFNPASPVHIDSDGLPTAGLFQHHAGRLANLIKAVPNWQTNWKGQVDFSLNEYQGYKNKKFSSPEAAALDWTIQFERPLNPASDQLKQIDYLKRNSQRIQKNSKSTSQLTPVSNTNRLNTLGKTAISQNPTDMMIINRTAIAYYPVPIA